MNPLVSIVIPTYNRAPLLARSIRSVLAQSCGDFELIVVDDASKDNTAEVVQGFDDPRIRYLCHEQNQGGAQARNTGIAAASGHYVAFQDSDDEWLLDKLALQLARAESDDQRPGVVYCGFVRWDPPNASYTPGAKVVQREGDIHLAVLRDYFISTQTVLVRRACFEAVGTFDARLPRFQDWELMIRLSQRFHFALVDEPLVLVHTTADSITRDAAAKCKARELILRTHYDTLAAHPEILADHQYAVGHLMCLQGRMAEGRAYLDQAVHTHRRHYKAHAARALARLGPQAYRQATQWRQSARG